MTLAASVLVPLWKWHGAIAPPVGQRVLMYHAIGSTAPGDAQGRYSIAPVQFAAQMEHLAASRRRVGVLGGALGQTEADVVITFDDGYRDNLTQAYPVLKRLGLAFTIFAATGLVRSGAPLYLNSTDLRTLAADPLVTIGAHGDSHTRLTTLAGNALHEELSSSKKWLEDATGQAVTAMSYPHGAVDARVREAVRAAGYSVACCSEFGLNNAGRDRLVLARTDIWNTDNPDIFKAKLAGEWDWMRFFTRCGL